MNGNGIFVSANDHHRRAKLRVFLTECRERLRGLTCEEVAARTDVGDHWYRSFESGSLLRVPVPYLARLSRTLELTPVQTMALFFLALPEIYDAYVAQKSSTLGEAV